MGMGGLDGVEWPTSAIRTRRLVLRESERRDRAALMELFASPEVGQYLGGARTRDELERTMPEVPGQRPGFFVVERDGETIGMVTLDRRDPARETHPHPAVGEVELGYLFLPDAWRHGYATEACTAVLDWCAAALPGQPVVMFTQTANTASMRLAHKLGFTEVHRYEAWGAPQWMGVRHPGPAAPGRD